MKLEDAVVRVKNAAKSLQRLEGAVRQRLEPSKAKGRQIPIVFTQSFLFKPQVRLPDPNAQIPSPPTGVRVILPMQLVQNTIVNGAEDCYLKEVSYTSYFSAYDSQLPENAAGIEGVDSPNRILTISSVGGGRLLQGAGFNFQWNATLISTQSNYLSQANNAQFLSRRSLGHASKAVRRQLYSNLLFKAGDALLVSVKPTYWGLPFLNSETGAFRGNPPHPSVNLTISFFGTRGPDMVELAEDEDLEP